MITFYDRDTAEGKQRQFKASTKSVVFYSRLSFYISPYEVWVDRMSVFWTFAIAVVAYTKLLEKWEFAPVHERTALLALYCRH